METSSAPHARSVHPGETAIERDQRMAWWREARFGLFIHWGLYAIPAGTWQDKRIPRMGEHIQMRARIPVADYAALAGKFNPAKFDADAWVRLARTAGMKYVVVTAKHHDGFAMFDTAVSSFDVVDGSPFGRDVVAEMVEASRRQDMKLGFYYSHARDWHYPGGSNMETVQPWDLAQEGNMDAYLRDVAVPQVRELLTQYGPIDLMWWDTPDRMTPERAAPLAELMGLQPAIITNNRLGGDFAGDFGTPENRVPATGIPGDWETCMTINGTWGFKSYDEDWKSSTTLIRKLVDVVSKGGNLLLNVGPTAEGEIPEACVERLQDIGAWLDRNGEAIYGTTASPFRRLDWGRATRKADRLYLQVFDWPADGELIVPMSGQVRRAHLLAQPEVELTFTKTAEGLRLRVPPLAPDPVASVIVLEGVGQVDPLPPPPLRQVGVSKFVLPGEEAELRGGLRVEGFKTSEVGNWRTIADEAWWDVVFDQAGTYEISLLQAEAEADAGSSYTVAVGEHKLTATTTGTDGAYVERVVGTLVVPKPGRTTVSLRPTQVVGAEFLKLRGLTLRRVTP